MPVRGFALTMDGLFALAIASAAIALVATSGPAYDNAAYYRPALARDYLDVKYSINSSMSTAMFYNSTFVEVTEVQPPSGQWLGADKRVYGQIAGCANSSNCLFNSSSLQAAYLLTPDYGPGIVKRAWVKTS